MRVWCVVVRAGLGGGIEDLDGVGTKHAAVALLDPAYLL